MMPQVAVELGSVARRFKPEQTMAAPVVPHPDAKYYALARSGGDDGTG